MAEPGQVVARSSIRAAVAAPESRVRGDRDLDAGRLNWREHSGLQRNERGIAEVAAGERSKPAGVLEDYQSASRDRHHRFRGNFLLRRLRCAATPGPGPLARN